MPFRNISMCFEKNWAKNAHWAIPGKCDQMRGYKTPCSILFAIFQRVGLQIFVLTIHKLQNAKDNIFLYLPGIVVFRKLQNDAFVRLQNVAPCSNITHISGRLSLESPHSFPTWIVQDYLISKQKPTEFKSVSSFSPQLTVFSLLLFSQDYQNLVFNIYENVIFLIEIFLIAWIDFN